MYPSWTVDMLKKDGFTPNQIEAIMSHLEETYFEQDLYEYADNLRIARADNILDLEAYENRFNTGCCGYYDEEIEVDGLIIKIGFNYGH